MYDVIVTTLPIKPQAVTNIGMCFAPLISELIGNKMGVDNILSTNLLHSYKDNEGLIDVYINTLKEYGIEYSELFIDREFSNTILSFIEALYKNDLIIERSAQILRCDCGKVDIVRDGLRTFDNGVLYDTIGNKIFCNSCGRECREKTSMELYLYLDPNVESHLNIVPNFLQRDLNHFYHNMPGKYILVSKKRKTGFKFQTVTGNVYNIDIDLIWMNFIQCFKQNKQVLVASNHQLYEMYLVNYINSMLFNKDLTFVATPLYE